MSVASTVDNHIASNAVTVFSKSYCPYCAAAKRLLGDLKANAKVFELDLMDDGSDWQAYLASKSGQRTVPNIWIGGKFIGGNSDLQAKHKSGELKTLIDKAQSGGKL